MLQIRTFLPLIVVKTISFFILFCILSYHFEIVQYGFLFDLILIPKDSFITAPDSEVVLIHLQQPTH